MKALLLIILLLISSMSFGQIPNIDPTAIQRLIELRNTVTALKKGLALQSNIDGNTKGDAANTTALLEAEEKIEDLLRDSDEYVKLAYNHSPFNDLNNLNRFAKNLKANVLGNLNSNAWKLSDLQGYLSGNTYTEKSGSEFYDALTKGISLDNKQGTASISDYYEKTTAFRNRQYALQTILQKKKMQQALTYYKMADELEIKALSINEGIKSQTAGQVFTLQNKGAFGLNKQSSGGLFDDFFSSNDVELPTFGASGYLVVNDKNYVIDATGNVYDATGNFVTNDIGFGAKEQALNAFLKDNPNLKATMGNAFDELMKNPFGLLGSLFNGGPKKPEDYLNDIMKARLEAKVQNEANKIQTDIYNNILKNALAGKGDNYAGLLNGGLNVLGSNAGTKSGLRMSTGERITGNKLAIDLITQAQELREKADALMSEALKRTDEQKQLDAVWQKEMIRKSLVKMTL